MIELVPKKYYQLDWDLVSKNRVDTVNYNLITNTPVEDTSGYTEQFIDAEVDGTYNTLPLPNDFKSTHYRNMSNSYWELTSGTREYAKSRLECVMARGEREVTVYTPFKSIPTAEFELVGTSYVIPRGKLTYDYIPSLPYLQDNDFSLSLWIKSQEYLQTQSQLSWTYNSNRISMNPWVKEIIDAQPITFPAPVDKIPTVITNWMDDNNNYHARAGGWSDTSNVGSISQDKIYIYPDNNNDYIQNLMLMYDRSLTPYIKVEQTGAVKYNIKWYLPVRFTYLAAAVSRNSFGLNMTDVDNWAFVDEISSVRISLKAHTLDKSTVAVSKGLDKNSGQLTDDVTQQHPLDIKSDECFTLNSIYETDITGPGTTPEKWSDVLALKVLTNWRDGKYIVKGTVPATWALINNIHINTEMYVKLQNNKYISRGNTPCIFRVKNIEKVYTQGAFKYYISLREK